MSEAAKTKLQDRLKEYKCPGCDGNKIEVELQKEKREIEGKKLSFIWPTVRCKDCDLGDDFLHIWNSYGELQTHLQKEIASLREQIGKKDAEIEVWKKEVEKESYRAEHCLECGGNVRCVSKCLFQELNPGEFLRTSGKTEGKG